MISPLSSFLLLQGIESVALRVERHVENARRVAEFLRADPRVAWVNYAGFADNPYNALAQKYFGGRACSLMTFGIAGGLEGGKKFYDALKLFKRLVNLGDSKSLACHPASTTHRQMSAEEQAKAGVLPETIRLSIGVTQLDGLIVTGNEPKSKSLKDEPYWPALSQVIDWVRVHTYSTICSCRAAHAAVFASDLKHERGRVGWKGREYRAHTPEV